MRQCGVAIYNWMRRLYECLLASVAFVFCCCYGNKVSAASETRQIEVGATVEGDRKKHNKIKTSKYTLLMFLPKNLMEQFRRVVNFYFLIVTVIAVMIDSPVSPLTSIAPLSFMVMVTAVKQGYEDWLRHKADNKVNNQIDILPQGMRIEVPNPVADLYTFYGRLEIPNLDSLVLSPDHLMLRGSRVKNTEWAIGCAIYTGEETKLALNSKYSGNKFSSCELAINGFLLYFIGLLIVEMFISLAAKLIIERANPERDLYLGQGTPFPAPLSSLLQDLFSFLLLYYYIIPMSMYVTIELYKFIGALFIGWDEELRCDETGRPAVANTSDLNEELGQVEVLFSDKTGTLTKNLMVFKACSIKGHVYEEKESRLYDVERFDEPVDTFQTDIKFFFTILALCHSVQVSNEDMKKLSARLSGTGNLHLMNFFRRKKIKSSGTNGVIDNVTWNTIIHENGNKMDYQGSSPDEKALVEAAERIGVAFLGEEGNNLLVKVGDHTEMYERLQIIEFTSERKRMSVILRDKDGKIWLFCKGAESSVFPLCKNSGLVEETNKDINMFANKGLRTLAVAYREVPEEEYDRVTDAIKRLDGKSADALQLVTQQYRVLEKQLTLVGATGVEDCLQDDVADTLAALRRAGVKTWVLTGDKVETAINVAQSCAHISENDRRMFLIGVEDDTTLHAHFNECIRIIHEPSYRDLTLVVDGTSMTQILDTSFASAFVDISLKCHAVLCCRLSPIQKAKIVKLIKNSPDRPITAAIGDGANDISMIQEAHVGFGIFGREGHQAARSADFAFTKFSMIKKVLLVMGHWYYQRLATLIHYFFYKNLVLGNIMFIFQIHTVFSTQSIFDSMYLTFYNLIFTSFPVMFLSVTEQRWSASLLLSNPTLYREISKNKLMSWRPFMAWCLSATYHSLIVYWFTYLAVTHSVISVDGRPIDLWCFGAALFHLMTVVVSCKLWLQTRYHTVIFVASIILSVLVYIIFNIIYSLIYLQIDGDVLGTYMRLLSSTSFAVLNVVVVIACLAPDYIMRIMSDRWARKNIETTPTKPTVFTTRL